MAYGHRLTNTGILQSPGTFDEYTITGAATASKLFSDGTFQISGEFDEITMLTNEATAVYPSTVTGTGLLNTGTGTFSWTCPVGVTYVSVVCVGGGGGSGGGGAGGGGGGALAYINNYSVTPGVVYTVVCGAGGLSVGGNANGTNGGQSYFNNVSTVAANGGIAGNPGSSGSTGGAGGTVAAGTGFAGGAGGNGKPTYSGGGGGGAGGYTAAGGAGGSVTGTYPSLTGSAGSSSASGGGGGGSATGTGAFNGSGGTGGGVGLLGSGTGGAGGATNGNSLAPVTSGYGSGGGGGSYGGVSGSDGSGSSTTPSANQGSYGGGAGGSDGLYNAAANSGSPGAVRIVFNNSNILTPNAQTKRKQTATSYQVYDSFDELSLAYTITPDKTIINEGDTVTYTVNAPLLGTGTLYWTNSGSTVAADFIGGLTQGLTPLTWSGTSTAAVWSAANIPQLSSSGNGTGAVFSFKKTGALATAATFGVLNVLIITPGTGYAIGDTILIDGVALTGLSSTYNITLTVGSDWFAQIVYPSTVTGTGMTATFWTCPDGVYRVSVVCIGGGGGGASGTNPGGGGGGALSYITDYPVVPGTNYAVTVGIGAAAAGTGGTSSFINTSTCAAGGGSPGTAGAGGAGGTVLAGTGFAGGAGGASATLGGGGGGAGGYSAAGGAGGTSSGASPNLVARSGANSIDGGGGGSTGGGAGGLNQDGTVNNSTTGNGGGGGGTNPNGTFGSGIGGVLLAGTTGAILGQSGTGGSGGATGGVSSATVGGAGGAYGGGGGGGTTTGGAGGAGTVRIIWNYPHGFLSPTATLTTVTNTVLLTAQAAMSGLTNNLVQGATSGLSAADTTGINTITNYGGTITSVASPIPFAGTFSNGGFATASYLTVYLPPKTWNPSTDTTWTLEGWLYMTTTGQFCLASGNTSGVTVFYIQWGGSGVAVSDGTNQPLYYSNTSLVINTWYHIAVVNNGGTLSLYFNGVLRASGANTLASNAIDTLLLGRNNYSGGGNYFLTGNLSNFRLVKGTAVYSGASFTVPTAALTAITNTLVLTCQSSTTVIDNSSSPSQVTSTGSVTAISQATAAQVPFTVGYSYLFNGTSHYLTVPSSSNFVFGATDDFTIEGWAYPSATTINKGLIYKRTGSGISGVGFGTSTTTINRFQLYVANATGSAWTVSDATAGTFAINTWYHFAITKINGYIYFYLNGLLTRQYAHTTAIYDDGSLLNIGRDPGGSFWVGNISNIRIIKGTALYYPPSTIVNRNYPDYPPVTTNSGSVTITNGTGTLLLPISQDVSQEGVQDIRLQLRSTSITGPILATAPTVLVADTSRPLALPGGGQCWCAYPDYVSGPNLVYSGTVGSFTFTTPKGYTTVSVVCIGGGGAGGSNGGAGGGGGALAYIASFAVTAGATYSVIAGYGGGNNTVSDTSGGASSFNTSTVIANGGAAGGGNTNPGGAGGTVGAGTGFAGGAGGIGGGGGTSGGGGGGAGGYTAAGGAGGAITFVSPNYTAGAGATSATGGGGGSAGGSSLANPANATGDGGGGGGTSPFGSVAVASGATVAHATATAATVDQSLNGRGGGGSGGPPSATAFGAQLGQRGYTSDMSSAIAGTTWTQRPNGGDFGGGGGGTLYVSYGLGGRGCVRIIWGTGRAYPATLTADRVSGFPAAVGNPSGQQ
jgi:phage-related protein